MADRNISVVIPVFNKAHVIERSIASVWRQTRSVSEVILVDDGSTDGSAERARAVWPPQGPPLRIVRQANSGPSAARNEGMRLAATPVVAFFDSDDEWEPHHIADLTELVTRWPDAGLFATGFRKCYPDGLTVRVAVSQPGPGLVRNPLEAACRSWFIHTSAAAVDRIRALAIGGFNEGERIGEDVDLFARVAVASPVAYTPRISSVYHEQVPGSLMQTRRWTPEIPPVVRSLWGETCPGAKRFAAEVLLAHAKLGLAEGNREQALRLLEAPQIRDTLRMRQMLWSAAGRAMPPPLVRFAIRFLDSRWAPRLSRRGRVDVRIERRGSPWLSARHTQEERCAALSR